MPKIAYQWDRHSRIFAGSKYAQPDIARPGQYIMPAFSCEDPPPPDMEAGQAAYRNEDNSAWEVREAPEPAPASPGDDYIFRDGDWWKLRFSKKDFLLLCGLPQIVKLNTAISAGNALAQTVHDLLFAADYIDVTDPATIQMVQMLTTEAAGSVLTAEQAAAILQGVKYESADNTDDLDNPVGPIDSV